VEKEEAGCDSLTSTHSANLWSMSLLVMLMVLSTSSK